MRPEEKPAPCYMVRASCVMRSAATPVFRRHRQARESLAYAVWAYLRQASPVGGGNRPPKEAEERGGDARGKGSLPDAHRMQTGAACPEACIVQGQKAQRPDSGALLVPGYGQGGLSPGLRDTSQPTARLRSSAVRLAPWVTIRPTTSSHPFSSSLPSPAHRRSAP